MPLTGIVTTIVDCAPPVDLRFLAGVEHLIPILVKSQLTPQIGQYVWMALIFLMNSALNACMKAASQDGEAYETWLVVETEEG